jgi:hypothetical protein
MSRLILLDLDRVDDPVVPYTDPVLFLFPFDLLYVSRPRLLGQCVDRWGNATLNRRVKFKALLLRGSSELDAITWAGGRRIRVPGSP